MIKWPERLSFKVGLCGQMKTLILTIKLKTAAALENVKEAVTCGVYKFIEMGTQLRKEKMKLKADKKDSKPANPSLHTAEVAKAQIEQI